MDPSSRTPSRASPDARFAETWRPIEQSGRLLDLARRLGTVARFIPPAFGSCYSGDPALHAEVDRMLSRISDPTKG